MYWTGRVGPGVETLLLLLLPSLGLDDLELEAEEFTQPSLLSDLDSLTEPSLDSLPGAVVREEGLATSQPPPASLEDELMLLRLLELQGPPPSSASPVVDSPEQPRPQRACTNPIVTADSIISTLQMEMATAGLTADAILAATRHLETAVRAPIAAERPCIAPRPSLGRLGSRSEEGAGVSLAGLLGESLGALLMSESARGGDIRSGGGDIRVGAGAGDGRGQEEESPQRDRAATP